jgi:hypothetical protein
VQVEDWIHKYLGLDRPIELGQPLPVITWKYAAGERVEVLKQKLSAVREKLSERNGWADSRGADARAPLATSAKSGERSDLDASLRVRSLA